MSVFFSELIDGIKKRSLEVYGVEIFCDGEIVFRHMIKDNIRYPIYSATKAFTATAIGIACDERKFSIEAPLCEYFEKRYVQNMPEKLRKDFCKLSVKRFLTMSVNGYPFRASGDDWLESVLKIKMFFPTQIFRHI